MGVKGFNPNIMMNEGPMTVGIMSTVIEGGGSLDTAIRDVAKNGPALSSKLFKSVTVDADTRTTPDVKTGLTNALTTLPAGSASYRRAIHMVIAASESGDVLDKKRMLKDASEISLNGLKETGETYSSSLNGPCMVIFGLGIMVPMVLMSILPLLNMGGMFGSSPFGSEPIVFITLVIVPCVIAALVISVKERNPFLQYGGMKNGYKHILVLAMAIPMSVVLWNVMDDATISIVISSSVVGTVSFVMLYPVMRNERIREKQEQFLKDAVFEFGNRLLSGENFETALVGSIRMRNECILIAEAVERELNICRGDVGSAIRMAIGPVSSRMADIFCGVHKCSLKDMRDAGRLAISVGRQLQDQDTVRKAIQNKLKSMTDMMTGTAAVFAPLVLGMSIAMLEPISKVMEGTDMGSTSIILTIYLAELCVLMAILTAYLGGRTGSRDIAYRIGMTLPLSMIVFLLCSNMGL